MCPDAADRFVIAQLSDLHCGDGRYDPEMLEKVIDDVNALCPDLVVIPGDLTVNGYRDQFEIAKAEIDRLVCPEVIVIPGNHDSRNVGYLHFAEMFGTRWDCRELVFEAHDPAVGCERVRIVSIDSSKPDLNDGELGRHRYDWLAEQLEGPPAFTIVVIHHHLVGIPDTGRERNIVLDAGDVLAILDRYSVDLVLAGHRHVPYVWQVNRMFIVTSGTASTWRTRGEIPPSYNVLTITPTDLEVSIIALDGSGATSSQRYPRRRYNHTSSV
ncbi:MAG: metallophosphoesterase [Anaerosomatales bacterium]|nr:metallophosphoesterase [Anaerosomatales bacterium]MDT8434484.1 metallophosphoesterase [Anaerosomatales bacterium]